MEQLWWNKNGSQTRALSVSHMFMSHLNPSFGWTSGPAASWTRVWSAWALAGLLAACPPCLLEYCVCKNWQWIFQSMTAIVPTLACPSVVVRRGHSCFSSLTFCVTCLTTKKKEKVPDRANSENQASQADRGAGTAWRNTEIRHSPLCPAERRFFTSQPPGSLVYFSMTDSLCSRDQQD